MLHLQDVKNLLKECDGFTLSLYLQVNPALEENQAETPAWKIYAKNALRDLDRRTEGDSRAAWEAVYERVSEYLENYAPGGKGLVLFYCGSYEQVYELPVMPHTNTVHFGKPMVAPLLWLMDEYERYIIVLADSEEAHFLTTYLGNIERQDAMASERFTFDFREKTLMPRPGSATMSGGIVTAGSHRDSFDDKMNDYIYRFHGDVARRIRDMQRELGAERIIIGGTEKAAHAVFDQLHETVQHHVVEVMPIPLEWTDQQVINRVLPVALEHERQREMEVVDQVIGAAKSGGRGALGYNDVMRALDMQQVETLVASFPSQDEESLHDLTLRALESGGHIELVHDRAAEKLNQHGGVAARLYYPILEV